jgi:hypothetical protein
MIGQPEAEAPRDHDRGCSLRQREVASCGPSDRQKAIERSRGGRIAACQSGGPELLLVRRLPPIASWILARPAPDDALDGDPA